MGQTWAMIRPPPPPITEKNLPDQAGKVFLITGATSGIGLELAKILYAANGTLYLAARSPSKLDSALTHLRATSPSSTGTLHTLSLDLSDLRTLKPAAETLQASTDRLDILFLNAGLMTPPQGSTTAQGHELQLGVNALANHLFAQLLTPLLASTAAISPPNSVRAVWVSSSAAELLAPTNGLDVSNLDYHDDKSAWHKYGVSKAGCVFLAAEYGRRHKGEGVVSVSLDPGGLKTELQRHVPWWQMLLIGLILREPVYGAYTELWAGFAEEVTVDRSGAFVRPWGNFGAGLRKDLVGALKEKGEGQGGSGVAGEFWEWCVEKGREFA